MGVASFGARAGSDGAGEESCLSRARRCGFEAQWAGLGCSLGREEYSRELGSGCLGLPLSLCDVASCIRDNHGDQTKSEEEETDRHTGCLRLGLDSCGAGAAWKLLAAAGSGGDEGRGIKWGTRRRYDTSRAPRSQRGGILSATPVLVPNTKVVDPLPISRLSPILQLASDFFSSLIV